MRAFLTIVLLFAVVIGGVFLLACGTTGTPLP
jgi:hypothetical protein